MDICNRQDQNRAVSQSVGIREAK